MNIQHSSESNDWYTPKWIIDKVYQVLGRVDFDPASNAEANEVVGASTYLSENSLETIWDDRLGIEIGTIYLNPPGGKTGNKSNAALFWTKLILSDFQDAIFMAFNIGMLQSTQQSPFKSICEFPLCIPKSRIKFNGEIGKRSPSHANAIVYVPRRVNRTNKFKEAFKDVGVILNG
jgi:hypothetical protein